MLKVVGFIIFIFIGACGGFVVAQIGALLFPEDTLTRVAFIIFFSFLVGIGVGKIASTFLE